MTNLIQAVRELRPLVRVRTFQGQPNRVGERDILPVARSITMAVGRPGAVGFGVVWNRPLALLEVRGNYTRRIPIPDVTRRIAALTLLASVLLFWVTATRLRQKHETIGD